MSSGSSLMLDGNLVMTDKDAELPITPETKVGAMLEHYPQLEEVLINMARAFSRLKNPILRKTVGKVATLRQVAQLGKIPLGTLINDLRAAAGQEKKLDFAEEGTLSNERPEWVKSSPVARTFDARPMIESGEHPMTQVLKDLNELPDGQLYELITPFIPAPLVDKARARGFLAWSWEEKPEIVKTYFVRSRVSIRKISQ